MGVSLSTVLESRNFVKNPTPKVNATGWISGTGTVVRDTAFSRGGVASFKFTKNASAGTGTFYPGTGLSALPVSLVGETHFAAAWVRPSTTARLAAVRIYWYTAAGASISSKTGTQVLEVSNQWTRLDVDDIAPATAAFMTLETQFVGCAAAEVHYGDTVIISEKPILDYFDGDTPNWEGQKYIWTGTANNSISEKRNLLFTYTPDPIVYTEDDYKAKFFAPEVHVTRRIEILEADGKTLWEDVAVDGSRLISGNISVDYARAERRSLDCELANFDQKLVHKPEGFWYDKVLRAYRGIKFRDSEGIKYKEYPLGKFMMDRVSQPRFPNTVKITARDFTKKAMLSKFTVATSFAKNTSIKTIIEALAANSGIYDRIIPVTTELLGSDTLFDRGTSRWDAMKQIAEAYSYELFFDASGFLVMRKFLDPTTSIISHEFLTGPEGSLVDWEKATNDTRLYNWVSVSGIADNQLPVRADAINNNPDSPTRLDAIGPRVLPFDSTIISTVPQAQELADSLLAVNGLEEYEINMSSLVAPWLEAGEIVRFADPDAPANDPDRFLLTSFGVPMGLGAMSAVGRRVTIVS